jgi:NAD(P)H dehydrogenase (quinone)
MIVVTGAAGGLGRLVVNRLVVQRLVIDHQVPVVAGTRTPDKLKPDLPAGVPVRRIDFDDPPSLAEGFIGADTVLLISAGQAEHDVVIGRHGAAIEAAEKAGVRHLVYTSLTGAGDHLAMALPHRWTERRLTHGPTTWTVLRNGLYAELLIADTAHAAATGVLTAPLGDDRIAAVAREDLADAAVRVLAETAADAHATQPGRHANKVYELVGDTAIGGTDLATLASRIAGNPVTYRPGTLADRRAALTTAGMPHWRIDHVISTYAAIAAGFLSNTDSILTDLLGTTSRPALPLISTAIRSAA